jgi:exopolysaccharide biosynthesis polyprenyl glycosylphosphotransferase
MTGGVGRRIPPGPAASSAAHPETNTTPRPAQDINPGGPRWRRGYARRLAVTDFFVLILTTVVATIWRFGFAAPVSSGKSQVSYVAIGVFIVVAWWLSLRYIRATDPKIVGDGVEEYRRIIRGTFLVFGWVAIVSLLFKSDLSRGYLGVAFPLGLCGLLAGRKAWRSWLVRHRRTGEGISKVLVIGGPRSAKLITDNLDATPNSGYRVTGVWVPDCRESFNQSLDVEGRCVPVLGTNRTIAEALSITKADTVIVTDSEHLGHDGLKSLAWDLAGADVDLMVSPNVIDVAGPRIHIRAVASMPLVHLEEPQYADASRTGKLLFDKTVALTALVALSPIMFAAAIAVKLSSPGPLLYRSTRIGVAGQPFAMLKFRTMCVDADQDVSVLTCQNEGAGPLFKMRDDPRVTTAGRFLRRYSIDELPQLLNVLRGDMSMVGPRPPLPSEVAEYEGAIERRLLVRQGITGLWQVNGRSDLTWEESVRLDLDYVENWSMARDLQIMWRTVRAVLMSRGAY